ncbi:MAG: Stf0 sulfotransferase, partial [Oxalobacteraceae bacterium]
RWMDALPGLRLVYLSRNDLLGQAISWARALQTKQYRSTQSRRGEAVYDSELIRSQLLVILQERALWEGYFARTGIQPLRIVYEQFVERPRDAVHLIADLLDVPLPNLKSTTKVDLQVQRDEISLNWRQKFLTKCGDHNSLR